VPVGEKDSVIAPGPANVRAMSKTFRPYSLDQRLLLPPDLREWVPEDDLVWFISDTVDELDLSAIGDAYEEGDGRVGRRITRL
jgi:hypothetical protein